MTTHAGNKRYKDTQAHTLRKREGKPEGKRERDREREREGRLTEGNFIARFQLSNDAAINQG